MKRIKFAIGIITITSIGLIGCKKQTPTSEGTEVVQQVNQKSMTTIQNPWEQYELTGELHNLALDAAIRNSQYMNFSLDEKYNFFHNYNESYSIAHNWEVSSNSLPELEGFYSYLSTPNNVYSGYEEMLTTLSPIEYSYYRSAEALTKIVSVTKRKLQFDLLTDQVKNESISDETKAFLIASLAVIENSKLYFDNNPDVTNALIGGGVWRADISGFKYGWKNPAMGSLQDHWQNGLDVAELASYEKRLENEFRNE